MQIFRLDAAAIILIPAIVAMADDASAFDCAKASNKYEKAICADPSARAADDAMSKAFTALMAGLDPDKRKTATAAQVAWLQQRNSNCAEAKGLAACLARESQSRDAFLSGAPEQGPGPSNRLTPWFRFEKGGKGKAAVNMEFLVFADPKTAGERAFNAAVMKQLESVSEPEKDDPGADRFEFSTHMRLTYASPTLISARADSYFDGGGAHPNSSVANFNLAQGKLAAFGDVFDAKSAPKIFARCADQVKAAKKERLGSDAPLGPEDLKELANNIQDATRDLGAWSFETNRAVVTYDPYAVGSYAEGYYECDLGYDELRPLAKSGFPLP